MPTGYTSAVGEGKVTSFEEYALTCARAFGACVMMRDNPLSSDIPEFEVGAYHYKNVENARKKLKDIGKMSDDELQTMWVEEYAQSLSYAVETIEKRRKVRTRYEAMLEKVKKFEAPTPDHVQYASFLVSQLEESIHWDCDESYYQEIIDGPQKPFDDWKKDMLAQLASNVFLAEKSLNEEIERTAGRNKWIKDLREAIKKVGESQ